LLLLESLTPEDLVLYVEIFADDVIDFTQRPALVAVDLPQDGDIRYSITPPRVTLQRR
jgi:hypothetical protein